MTAQGRMTSAMLVAGLLLPPLLSPTGCGRPRLDQPPYQPHLVEVTMTTVPFLTREMQAIYPFLTEDFTPGGVLAGKEIYGFVPSSVTVLEGDTIRFRFINPEDDVHSFVLLPDLSVALPGQSEVSATYVARRAGLYPFTCSVPSHLPAMWGQLVVLTPSAVGRRAVEDGLGRAAGDER